MTSPESRTELNSSSELKFEIKKGPDGEQFIGTFFQGKEWIYVGSISTFELPGMPDALAKSHIKILFSPAFDKNKSISSGELTLEGLSPRVEAISVGLFVPIGQLEAFQTELEKGDLFADGNTGTLVLFPYWRLNEK